MKRISKDERVHDFESLDLSKDSGCVLE